LENTICSPGLWGPWGNAPCTPCAAGLFGAIRGAAQPTCSGPCPPGRYSSAGSSTCAPCPAGRFANATGAGSALCMGPCVPEGPGFSCPPAAVYPGGELCPIGSFAGALGACELCPAGQYGDAPGLGSPECSGACSAGPGYYCGLGSTSPFGMPCPPGTFSNTTGASCTPCPPGVFGSASGLTSEGCTGVCNAPPGSYCPLDLPGATSPKGVLCPPGKWSGGGSSVCQLCTAGYFGSALNATNSNCSGPCPIGRYSLPSAEACTVCPGALQLPRVT
jgi:hypothetical protein